MTLERVVSVTTFTNDNQVTTTLDRRPTFVEEDRGYSTITIPARSHSTKHKDSGIAKEKDVLFGSREPLQRAVSQPSVARPPSLTTTPPSSPTKPTPSSEAIPIKDFRHPRKRGISFGASTAACDSNFNSSTNLDNADSDIIHNTHHSVSHSHSYNPSYQKSRYKKHDSSNKCSRHSTKNKENLVLGGFPAVKKSQSESALCPKKDKHSRNDYHNPSKRDCNGNLTRSSGSGRHRYPSCSSPESPKQSTACALSYVFPWSQKTPNRSNRRYNRSQSGDDHNLKDNRSSRHRHHHHHHNHHHHHHQDNNHDHHHDHHHDQNHHHHKSSSSLRKVKSSSTQIHSSRASKEDLLSSSRPDLASDVPLSPVSAPTKTPFQFTREEKTIQKHSDEEENEEEFPKSPNSAPTYMRFPLQSDEDLSSPRQRKYPSHQSRTRSRPEHRNKYKPTTQAVRDRSEDAFYKEGIESVDFDTNKSFGGSRKSLQDSNSRLYQPRSNHSSSHRRDTNQKPVSSSGASGSKSRKSQRRPSGEEGSESQCHTAESSTESSRKSGRSRSVDLEPKVCVGRFNPEADLKVITDAEDFVYRPTDMTGRLHLSFCGCGFLGMYHLGVASSLINRAPTFLKKVHKFGGASAGALMAALLVTSRDRLQDSIRHFQALSKEIRSKPLGALTPGYSLAKSLRLMLDDVLPEDAHLDASGRLFVSLTNGTTKKNEIWSEFASREELMQVLVATCFIPMYAGSKLPLVRGKRYLDGGLTNNLIEFDSGRTIKVSPFDGKSDIGPKAGQEATKKAHFLNLNNQSIQINMQNLKRGTHAFFPPRKPVLQDYFDKGRFDASRFLIREGFYEIEVQQPTQSVVYESYV